MTCRRKKHHLFTYTVGDGKPTGVLPIYGIMDEVARIISPIIAALVRHFGWGD